ncbi:hypothetical protein WK04_15675 [Burkholderia ubonensis]|nr:hypothetical protein WK04_15675 [Burkholderia ubonensis]
MCFIPRLNQHRVWLLLQVSRCALMCFQAGLELMRVDGAERTLSSRVLALLLEVRQPRRRVGDAVMDARTLVGLRGPAVVE